MSNLKRTQLYDLHTAAGATMVDFGGWEMPMKYPTDIVAEHLYTRHSCSLFDVSHMGRILVEGPEAVPFLQHVLSSNVASLDVNRAQYAILPNENGGTIDDAYLNRFESDRYFLVVNAANTDKDLAHLSKHIQAYNAKMTVVTSDWAAIAVQGPRSEEFLRAVTGGEFITAPGRNALNTLSANGRTLWVARTGYTGEPVGYEVYVESDNADWLWNSLVEAGAKPAGLGARDTLRLEAGLPLYGHEMGLAPDSTEIPILRYLWQNLLSASPKRRVTSLAGQPWRSSLPHTSTLPTEIVLISASFPAGFVPSLLWAEVLCVPVCLSTREIPRWASLPAEPWFPIIPAPNKQIMQCVPLDLHILTAGYRLESRWR